MEHDTINYLRTDKTLLGLVLAQDEHRGELDSKATKAERKKWGRDHRELQLLYADRCDELGISDVAHDIRAEKQPSDPNDTAINRLRWLINTCNPAEVPYDIIYYRGFITSILIHIPNRFHYRFVIEFLNDLLKWQPIGLVSMPMPESQRQSTQNFYEHTDVLRAIRGKRNIVIDALGFNFSFNDRMFADQQGRVGVQMRTWGMLPKAGDSAYLSSFINRGV